MIADVQLEHVPCPMGCPPGDTVVLEGRDRIHNLPGRYTIRRCVTCGLMRTDPRPTPEAMGFYYPDDYGPYQGTQVKSAPAGPRRFPRLRARLREALDPRYMYLPPLKPGRMLEMGCASGLFLDRMARQGWDVQGVEFSATAAAAARALGYPVHAGPMETAPVPDRPYDLIVGWMVLEHLHDPLGVLKRLADWSTPDATLAFSVPNAASWDFKVFGTRWYALHLPNHLHHFTPDTLRALLDRAGWEITHIHAQRIVTDPVASVGYLLQDLGLDRLGRFLGRVPEIPGRWIYTLFPLAWLASQCGQTARMTVWARRRATRRG